MFYLIEHESYLASHRLNDQRMIVYGGHFRVCVQRISGTVERERRERIVPFSYKIMSKREVFARTIKRLRGPEFVTKALFKNVFCYVGKLIAGYALCQRFQQSRNFLRS